MAISKKDIAKQVAESTGLSIKDTEATINNFLDTIASTLKTEEKVPFIGFGTFKAKNVPARTGRNPKTGEALQIAARRQVSFTPGADLKKKVN